MNGERIKRYEEPSVYNLDLEPLVTFDCVIEEKAGVSMDVASLEVEEGFEASDHIRPKPREMRMTASFTNTPGRGESDGWRDISMYREFVRITRLGQPLVLVCGLDILNPCAIVDVSAPRSSKDGQQVKMDITFRELRTVRAAHVQVSRRVRASLAASTTQTQDDGLQQGEDAEESDYNSLLYRFGSALGGG